MLDRQIVEDVLVFVALKIRRTCVGQASRTGRERDIGCATVGILVSGQLVSVLVNAGESAIALVRTELMAPQASTNSTSLTTFGESVMRGIYDQIASGSVERRRFNAGIVGSTPESKRKVLRD